MISQWIKIWGRHKYLFLTEAIFLQQYKKKITLEICRKHSKMISSFHCTRCSSLACVLPGLSSYKRSNQVIKMEGQGGFFRNLSSRDMFCISRSWRHIFWLHKSMLIISLKAQISESIYATSHSVTVLRIPVYQWQNALFKERNNS